MQEEASAQANTQEEEVKVLEEPSTPQFNLDMT